jgi:hypothetical protein
MKIQYWTRLGICDKCGYKCEYNFNAYGATQGCIECGAPSIEITEIGNKKKVAK